MQIGIRLHDTVDIEFKERLLNVKKQGFSCIHLALQKIKDLPHENTVLTKGYADYIKRAVKEADIDIAVLGCYLNLAHPDSICLKNIQDAYKAYLRFASYLGGVLVGTETGAPNALYKYDKEACHSKEALDLFINNLKPVVSYAQKLGVILAIEPVYKHIVWNPKVARKVLDRIDSPNLQIIFDPVNLLHADNLSYREEVIEEAIDLLGNDIAMVHLKDYILDEENELSCMACGLGDMDYKRVMSFIREKKPYIHATLENTKPENAVAAMEYLKSI